ncbi:helix-turn-helix domain-containing protein [Leptolyngbya sp. FACHB-321]|uniref:winged helix-turn-helix transcriptional regulator n=1 Tax=Leptolyngbya sp. FACHB-321 TaxID=2692807 RepID=UPI0018EFEEF7|nr:helix-turn-helix domain-containing protein [Leptolyngbya sp. FACHB-321]
MSHARLSKSKSMSAAAMLEYIVGCKWSIRILTLVRQGVDRPGAITRSIEGLTTKVQSDCLSKMVSFNILQKVVYPEVPPRVEYKLTAFGQRFVTILDAVAELQRELETGCFTELSQRQIGR